MRKELHFHGRWIGSVQEILPGVFRSFVAGQFMNGKWTPWKVKVRDFDSALRAEQHIIESYIAAYVAL